MVRREDLEGDDRNTRYAVHESRLRLGSKGDPRPETGWRPGDEEGFFLEEMIMRDERGTEYPRVTPGLRQPSTTMKMQKGKMGYLLLWLVGIPIPILLLIFLLRGCN